MKTEVAPASLQSPRTGGPRVEEVRVSAYKIPTASPESDGTYEWDATTLVLVEASAGGLTGLGYTYADEATAHFIDLHLADVVKGSNALEVTRVWHALAHRIRNLGRAGLGMMAVSAVDAALWDLKAKLLGLPLVQLWGLVQERIPVYGSGGFTSYTIQELQRQLGGWASEGMRRVKMKLGREPDRDLKRVEAAREAIGPQVELFVDANGAYSRKQALAMAEKFQNWGVTWFEEPVSSEDLQGLHLLRNRAPGGMNIAAGEYGHDVAYFYRMLKAEAVDVLQADATRCSLTGFLETGTLCAAESIPFSAHCAPSLHVHACCALKDAAHVEYFFDHTRIESMLFEGAARAEQGFLSPDLSRPGLGLEFRRPEAKRYAVYGNP